MRSISLNGPWQLTFGEQSSNAPRTPAQLAESRWQTIPAAVPGNVELDLLRAGLIADPSVGERAFELRKYEPFDWWYEREFDAPPLRDGERAELVFGGVDCLATVWLNERCVGSADNMLIEHRFDITEALRHDRPNTVCVRIESTTLAARSHPVTPLEHASATNYEALRIRKAPHSFGWDILPRLVSAGLWRGVSIQIQPATRIRDVYFGTLSIDARTQSARALLTWNLAADRALTDSLSLHVRLRDGDRTLWEQREPVFSTHGRCVLDLTGVRFWWPRGAGEATLHELQLDLLDENGAVLDSHQTRVGIRAIELVRTDLTTPDGAGEFLFRVNGEPIFAKGTNWVPLDALHSRDPQHLDSTFGMLLDLNCNMVRCWGGNVYEDHAFFDLCDRHGVMVWQDFAMGCAVYPQDDTFAKQIEREAIAIVSKLRNHPSLAIWAGNNEGDEAYEWAHHGVDPNTDRLTREVLPRVVRSHDPLRTFLPSSPYRAPAFFAQKGAASDVLPEQHLWGPRDDFKGATYAKTAAHFASEIGYHGCPDVASLEQMMEPGRVWPWRDNPQWLAKAVRPHPSMKRFDFRIPLMANQIGVLFERIPDTLDDFVLASQISQAEAFKFFIEWFRQGKWRRTGILWWNLRDGWPVISDAIVDYYGRRKLAYAYVKRVQTDVCVICAEPKDGEHDLVVANDSQRAETGTFVVRDADRETKLAEGHFSAPTNGVAAIGTLAASTKPAMWRIDYMLDNGTHGINHYLAGPRPFDLERYKRWLAMLSVRG